MGLGILGRSLINVSATHIKVSPLGHVVATGLLSIQSSCYESTYNTQPLHLLAQPTFLVWFPLICFILPMFLSTQMLLHPHQTLIMLLTHANILIWGLLP